MERRLLASEKEGSIQTQRQLADKDYKIDMGKSKVFLQKRFYSSSSQCSWSALMLHVYLHLMGKKVTATPSALSGNVF